MKPLFICILLLQYVTVIAQPFTLDGQIHQMKEGLIRLSYFDPVMKRYRYDTAVVKQEKFQFAGVIQGSCRATLLPISNQELPWLVLYLQAGQNVVEGSINNWEYSGVKAGADQMVNEKYTALSAPLIQNLSTIRDSVRAAERLQEKQPDSKALFERAAFWQQQEQAVEEELTALNKCFVLAHSESIVSGDILSGLLDIEADSVVNALFFSLHALVQQHPELQQLHARANMRPGAKAPSFDAVNVQGDSIRISFDKQQPLTLLDFWASWCGPCRADVPKLKKLQSKYGIDKLAVLPVSIHERKKEKWLEAIKEDSTSHWPHVYSQRFIYNCASMAYGVQAIPVKILIDADGKIVYRSESGGGIEGVSTFLKNYFGY